jgi:hypothetical protein
MAPAVNGLLKRRNLTEELAIAKPDLACQLTYTTKDRIVVYRVGCGAPALTGAIPVGSYRGIVMEAASVDTISRLRDPR